VNYHSNSVGSQPLKSSSSNHNPGAVNNRAQTGGNSANRQTINIPRRSSEISRLEPALNSNNYRQIPIRTIDVDQQLQHLKNKFNPHLVKPKPAEAPLPQPVAVKVVKKSQPILQNIIPQAAVFHQTEANHQPPTGNVVQSGHVNKHHDLNQSNDSRSVGHKPDVSEINQPNFNQYSRSAYQQNISHNPTKFPNNSPKASPIFSHQIYSKDYQQKIQPKTTNAIIPHSKFYQNKPGKKRFLSRIKSKRVVASILMFLISATIFGVSGFVYFQRNQNPTAAVAGVVEGNTEFPKLEEYKTWIEQKTGTEAEPQDDIDNDQLSNYEEFILESDPISANTCNPEVTDSQNLFAFINPVTCKPIDFNNPQEAEKFEGLISFSNLQQGFLKDVVTETPNPTAANSSSLLNLFGVENYTQLDSITSEQLDAQLAQKTTKKEYLRLVGRIDDYVKQFRSYEALDRNYPAPVHPATYLEVSLKYQVPLKYTIAIARTESRFGTDRYTASGNLTRPGQFQNIYSMGLTDGGQNLKFNKWEDGVEAFGKWYKKFNDRGVSNCAKWRIYNPNGDYCSKIEALAASIDIYLQSN